ATSDDATINAATSRIALTSPSLDRVNSSRPVTSTDAGSADGNVTATAVSSRVVPRGGRNFGTAATGAGVHYDGFGRGDGRLRIASWSLGGYNQQKSRDQRSVELLMRVVRGFDLVALQQISSAHRDLIPDLVNRLNAGGRQYDYLLGPETGPDGQREILAFIFDTQRVLTDHRQMYVVGDTENLFVYDPVVAWFRAAMPNPDTAWTFSMVNVRLNLGRARQEVAALPDMFAAVRNDGRGEDDVVMAGIFQADDAYLLPTMGESVQASIIAAPTDIFGRYQVSNLLLDADVTTEVRGPGRVVDFRRQFDLAIPEAERLTPHLPVAAEFSAVEGGQ
ncbi:MAG: hypothetical protein AAFN70_13590, partial [Planctomycetota bacterium]